MGSIYRLDHAALVRALSLRGPSFDATLFDGVLATIDISRFLFAESGASPAPVFPAGSMNPVQRIGTAAFNTPGATNRSGVLNLWGAGLVSGVDPPNKFSKYDTPPNRDYEIWGARLFFGMNRGAIGEGNVVIQATNGSGLEEDELIAGAFDYHETNGMFDATMWHMLPAPYFIEANTQLFFKWQINNITGTAQDFDLQAFVYWRYH